MEELETLYKPIPAYSTNEYKVAGRNLHIDKTEAFEKISRRVKSLKQRSRDYPRKWSITNKPPKKLV